MRVMAGVPIGLLISACSAISVNVPKKKPASPDFECSYKMPIIASATYGFVEERRCYRLRDEN